MNSAEVPFQSIIEFIQFFFPNWDMLSLNEQKMILTRLLENIFADGLNHDQPQEVSQATERGKSYPSSLEKLPINFDDYADCVLVKIILDLRLNKTKQQPTKYEQIIDLLRYRNRSL